MKQHLSLQFIKDLIDLNLFNKELLTKSNQLLSNNLSILNLNKEFKVFIHIIHQVILKRYDFIFIVVEDPFLYQLFLKKVIESNRATKIPIIISTKHKNIDSKFNGRKILTINISNDFKNINKIEDIFISINNQNIRNKKNTGVYTVSSNIDTVKALIFFLTLILNLLKINK